MSATTVTIGSFGAAEGDVSSRMIRKTVEVSAEPAAVFAAWTRAESLRAWLVPDARVELRIGGPFELLFDMDQPEGLRGSEGCRVLAWVPDRLLAFTWNAPPHFPEIRGLHTWVVVELSATEAGTRMHITHLGWPDSGFVDGSRWPEVFAYFERAWGMVTGALKQHFG